MSTKPARKRKARRAPGELSPVVKKVVQMLKREAGASLAQLQEALPDTKLGYLRALLHRILREKGIKVVSVRVEGQKAVVYKIN
jgi:hypothetical protein